VTKAEILIEGRQRVRSGEFDRVIERRTPYDLSTDDLALACGHSILYPAQASQQDTVSCHRCADNWLWAAMAAAEAEAVPS
jgi:hypothetical protein